MKVLEERDIPIEKIKSSPLNTRRVFEDIDELADNIREVGLINNLVVRPIDDSYEVINGERRLKAIEKLGWTNVRCKVIEATDKEVRYLIGSENIRNKSMTHLEYGELFLQQKELDNETYRNMASKYQWTEKTIANLARVSRRIYPSIKKYSQASNLKLGYLEEIARLTTEEDQLYILKLSEKMQRDELRKVIDKALEINQIIDTLPECNFKQEMIAKYYDRKGKFHTEPNIVKQEIESADFLQYVSKSNIEWTDYGINIFYGCKHDCKNCYGKSMYTRMYKDKWKTESWTDVRQKPLMEGTLRKQLEKLDKGTIMFCSITDAYQPDQDVEFVRRYLKILGESKHTILILTKSALVERDLDMIREYPNIKLGFSILTLDDDKFRDHSNASLPSSIIEVIKKAHRLGVHTWVSVEPWIIDFTKPIEIVNELKEYVDEWVFGSYQYSEARLEDYQPYIGKLHSFLIENHIHFRMKAELDRVFKSSPILSREEFLRAEQQLVGRE